MRTFILYLLLLTFGLHACHQTAPKSAHSPDYEKALGSRDPDTAFFYWNKVTTSGTDRMEAAVAFNYMARIQADAGDYFGSQESLLRSLSFLHEKNKDDWWCLASDYNELGLNSINLKTYQPAYFDQAFRFTVDTSARLALLNNKALAYQKLGNYRAALAIYASTIKQVKKEQTFARILSNMARTQWLRDPKYPAAAELRKALKIRERSDDLWGQNASFIHLSDFYATFRPDSALFFARKEYEVAIQLQSPDDILEALERRIKLEPASVTQTLFAQYRRLNDSLTTARSAAKNQFAVIRYEVEKNKADNLKLQQENTVKRIWIMFIISTFIVLSWLAIRFYHQRKRRLELAAQMAVIETQESVSQKVHDTLANDIYRVLKRVQHDQVLDRVWLEEHINEAYEIARDLAHEIKTDPDESYADKIADLLSDFSTADVAVIISGCEQDWWQKINMTQRAKLKLILQELMVNMQKHSQANEVIVRFETGEQEMTIAYSDNGIGIDGVDTRLKITGNRINEMGGLANFASTLGQGLNITIRLPVI